VTDSDLAASDHVVIRCPACGASEAADAAVLSDAPMIVCRNCGETWPAEPRRTRREPLFDSAPPAVAPAREIVEAERRPLVTFSEGVEKAWAAKIEADVLPEEPRRRRYPLAIGAVLGLLFVAAFLGGRQAAVAALPDLAGLYAAVGLPVNLDGLVIEDVQAERSEVGEEGAQILVRGTIRNVSGGELPIPALAASFSDAAGTPAGWRGFDPPARRMAAGEQAPFQLEIQDVPRQAAEIVIRFRQPAPQPDEGEVATAEP
jgi:hypothetical protein